MRRRVIQATVAAVAVAVLLLGLPLMWLGARSILDGKADQLESRVEMLSRTVDRQLLHGDEVTPAMVESASTGRTDDPTAWTRVQLPDGRQLTAGDEVTSRYIQRSMPAPQSNAIVIMRMSYWDGYRQAVKLVLFVIAAAVIAFVAGIGMAVFQANRLSAPFVYLAGAAEQLGSGQTRPRIKPSGIEEIDLVAAELARSADRLAGRLAAERQFASDASHQLRTPLTALTMRLEEISMASDDPDIQTEARISLEQVERLVGVVDDLLANSRRVQSGETQAINLNDVVEQQREEWEPTFTNAGRELEIDIPRGFQVLASPGGLAQVLATLIENSLKHGAGTTTVRARQTGKTGALVIEVADQGVGVPDDIAPRIFERSVTTGRGGTGTGLALARDLAAADGGRLELAQRRPAVFALFLAGVPRTLDPKDVMPAGRAVSAKGIRRRRRWLRKDPS